MISLPPFSYQRYSRILVLLLTIALLTGLVSGSGTEEGSSVDFEPGAVHFFHSPICASCYMVMPFIESYREQNPDIPVYYHDISGSQEDILLFEHFRKMHQNEQIFVPVVFIGDQLLVGEDLIFADLDATVRKVQETGTGTSLDLSAPSDITINPVILLLAALGEGFNPCGLLVLALLLVSLMASDSKRTIMLVGTAYIVAFFLVRLLSGFAIFSVIQLPGVARTFLIVAGVIAIIAGIWQIKDGLLKKQQALFSIPQSKKGTISKYLKKASVPAGFIVGGLTGLYGMACTVGIYISILGMIYQDFTSGLFFLLAYNFVVILPLIGILLLVLFGLSPEKLNSWRDERKSQLRLIIGVIMLAMGIIILVPIFF